MGAWGTGIYENDKACDARDIFFDCLASGMSYENAISEVRKTVMLGTDECDAAAWYALADTVLGIGMVDNELNEKVLCLIEKNPESDSWTNRKLNADRVKELKKLARKIRAAM